MGKPCCRNVNEYVVSAIIFCLNRKMALTYSKVFWATCNRVFKAMAGSEGRGT